ncbi:endocuticle structural glycoprotein SgAbd-5-like [Aricia agestis]|uniref:endocuticle structural glycoprotein SgAbd-5-like n=1 Tax=Aricia agestis TaxID=91739 RepID=UPI001C2050DB|nr:endocuticle structural glycoprotein SgAbd-5-like [Aricia agestis]
MKLFVVILFVGLASAAQIRNQRASVDPKDVQILRYNTDNIGLDGYKFDFELSDGTKRDEQAELRNAGTDDEAIAVKGSYSWIGPDGVKYTVIYTADENGFQPRIEQEGPGSIPAGVVASLVG